MEKHDARTRTPPARLKWWLWPDRNPLRRRCDRAEVLVMMALTAAFLTGAPLLSLTAGEGPHKLVAVIAAGPVVLAALLGCVGLAVHSVLDSRRLSAWEAAWSVAGPRWTKKP
jgi:hypothetical protein